MKNIIKLSLTLLFFLACNQNNTIKEEFKKYNSIVSSVNIEKDVSDSIEIDLSDISKDLQIVSLETSESVVLNGCVPIISNNFIVVVSLNDYYLFDRNGKFLRRLIKIGRGPEEFIEPNLSNVIRNDILYFCDERKNKRFIYSIDLLTGKLSIIPKTNEDIIQALIPDSDSTLLIISRNWAKGTSQSTSSIVNYSLIRQDFKGQLLSKISLGSYKSYGVLPPPDCQLFMDHEEILISLPRCDSILRYSNEKLSLLWQNNYNTNYAEQLSIQKVPFVELIHYSNDTILLSKSHREYRGNMYNGEKDQILLMNRVANKLVAVKRLYFKDKKIQLNKKSIHLFPDNLFAIVLKPEELVQMLNEQQIKQSIMKIMIPKALAGSETISDFNNPYILIGRFK